MKDIPETLRTAGAFTTLLSLLEQAGVAGRLGEEGPFTLFAPKRESTWMR